MLASVSTSAKVCRVPGGRTNARPSLRKATTCMAVGDDACERKGLFAKAAKAAAAAVVLVATTPEVVQAREIFGDGNDQFNGFASGAVAVAAGLYFAKSTPLKEWEGDYAVKKYRGAPPAKKIPSTPRPKAERAQAPPQQPLLKFKRKGLERPPRGGTVKVVDKPENVRDAEQWIANYKAAKAQ